jgi:hypothetical protein
MATFPSWISKRNNNNNSPQNLSPRQMANKAHSLAIKKLDRDDKRKRPQYSIRERLLLSKTMVKAEEVLNKKPTMHRSTAYFDDDDMMPPFQKSTPVESNKQPVPMTPTKKETMVTESCAPNVNDQIVPFVGQSDSALPTLEQMAAVSLVVVTVVASLNNSNHPQKSSLVSHDFCRSIIIPSHPSYTTII